MSLLGGLLCLAAWTGVEPELGVILPRGGQRGTEVDVKLYGRRLDGAQELMFHGPGFEVLSLSNESDRVALARLRIAADCELGEHSVRVRTAGGISRLHTFWVGPFPIVDEVEDNGDFAAPQAVPMNCTVHGRVKNEDLDHYSVQAVKGQRLSAEVEGLRLGSTLFDPYVAILDAERFEQAACDDCALLLQDPVATMIVPEDGTYVIAVRDAAFGGSDQSWYRLHIGSFPRPSAVYPPGGKAGETLSLRLLGDPGGELTATVTLPDEPRLAHPVFPDGVEVSPPSGNGVRVWIHDDVMEEEPNADPAALTAVEAELPLAFNGILQEAGDMDWFRFRAQKGRKYRIRVLGRRLRSPIDSVLNVYRFKEDGRLEHLVGNDDDNRLPDSELDLEVPADGEYALRVRDHLMRGGPTFVYRVEVAQDEPLALLTVPNFGRDSQARKQVAVPRGNRSALLFNVQRRGFGGPLELLMEGLAPGLTMVCEPIPGNLGQVLVEFQAAADAPLGGTLIEPTLRHADLPDLRSMYYHDVQLVTGAPNRTVYYRQISQQLPVVVSEEAPFTIELVPPKVPLVLNGGMNLEVIAHRKEGFDAPITVRWLWKPPGIGARATVDIPKGKDRALYPINAAGNARVGTWKVAVMGETKIDGGDLLASSALTPLTVAEPFLGMSIEMTALEQGQAGEVLCKLEHHQSFEGKAQARLYGLPAEVQAPVLEITADQTELVFPITTTAKTPRGQHKNLFCHVVVPMEGGGVAHNLGQGGVLRIDVPSVKPVAKAPEPAPPKVVEAEAPREKPKKRLSRLEQLRLQAAQAREAEKAEGAGESDRSETGKSPPAEKTDATKTDAEKDLGADREDRR